MAACRASRDFHYSNANVLWAFGHPSHRAAYCLRRLLPVSVCRVFYIRIGRSWSPTGRAKPLTVCGIYMHQLGTCQAVLATLGQAMASPGENYIDPQLPQPREGNGQLTYVWSFLFQGSVLFQSKLYIPRYRLERSTVKGGITLVFIITYQCACFSAIWQHSEGIALPLHPATGLLLVLLAKGL